MNGNTEVEQITLANTNGWADSSYSGDITGIKVLDLIAVLNWALLFNQIIDEYPLARMVSSCVASNDDSINALVAIVF